MEILLVINIFVNMELKPFILKSIQWHTDLFRKTYFKYISNILGPPFALFTSWILPETGSIILGKISNGYIHWVLMGTI